MKRGIYSILLLLFACSLSAQSDFSWIRNKEGKMIAVPKRVTFNLNLPKFTYFTYTPSERQFIESKLKEFMPDMPSSYQERPMDMQVASDAYKPFFNVFTPMIRRVSPMALDFDETSITPIDDHLAVVVRGQQYTWPGVGGITRINPQLLWQNDRVSVIGGLFAGRYFTPFNPSPQLTGGFNLLTSYEVNDLITLKAWGQYAFYNENEQRNPHMLMNPFYNHTSVGGALEFKVTDDFKVGVGMNYEYNPVRGKMEPQYLIYPTGKSGRIKLGIH